MGAFCVRAERNITVKKTKILLSILTITVCILFGCEKKNIIAVIGPSICQECYEVSQDVMNALKEQYSEEQMKEIVYCSSKEEADKKKYQLNLWKANALQLKEAGLLKENIHISGICTCCNSKLLFSHRASKGKRGNLNGFISLLD